jgi:hypothetical protein
MPMVESENLTVKYRNQIRPILEMLKSKKLQLSGIEWENLVRRTEQSIVNSPHQYLSELPRKDQINQIIFELFEEFLREGHSA